MAMSLDQARQVRLEAKRGRYDKDDVDRYIGSILYGYEMATRERDELRARTASLESQLAELRELEDELRDSLVAAQRVARDLRDSAQKDRDEILEGARDEAANLRRAAAAELERLEQETARVREAYSDVRASYRQFLAAALDVLDNATNEREPALGRSGATQPTPSAAP